MRKGRETVLETISDDSDIVRGSELRVFEGIYNLDSCVFKRPDIVDLQNKNIIFFAVYSKGPYSKNLRSRIQFMEVNFRERFWRYFFRVQSTNFRPLNSQLFP